MRGELLLLLLFLLLLLLFLLCRSALSLTRSVSPSPTSSLFSLTRSLAIWLQLGAEEHHYTISFIRFHKLCITIIHRMREKNKVQSNVCSVHGKHKILRLFMMNKKI